MRALAVFALVLAVLIVGAFLLFPSQMDRLGQYDLARMIFLMALALFVGAGVFSQRGRGGGRLGAGRALLYAAIWIGVVLLLFFAREAWDWVRGAMNPNVVT